jgi:hypothetical protein
VGLIHHKAERKGARGGDRPENKELQHVDLEKPFGVGTVRERDGIA